MDPLDISCTKATGCTKIKSADSGGFDGNGVALPGYPQGIGLQGALGLLAGINFLGMMCTFFVPETANYSLEDLSGELAIEEKHKAGVDEEKVGNGNNDVFKAVQVSPA